VIDVERDFQRMQDYIVGRLPEDEHRAFEDRLARDPDLVREFEQSLRLREGLEQLREQRRLLRSAPLRTGFVIALPLLAAAALAAVALFVRPVLTPAASSGLLASAPSNVSLPLTPFTFVAVRGESTPVVSRPAAGLVDLQVAPGAGTPPYHMSLSIKSAGSALRLIGTQSNLQLASDRYVHAYVDAASLPAGDYQLRLESANAAPGTAQTFEFTLRMPGSG
jgi:hypothetical protein